MKRLVKFLLLSAALVPAHLHAQYEALPGEGPSAAAALTPEMLKTLDESVPITPQLQAVRDALANNSVRSLAINPDVENATDKLFTKEIKEPGSIADQKQSGRCWLFAGL
ncbi:MAG TPA: C1 family peptidase, partial [Verrucomicrobiae bacterium]